MQQIAHLANVYQRFLKYAASKGYKKNPPEEIVISSTKTFDVASGVAGVDTGSPAEKQVLDGTQSDLVLRTQDPVVSKGNNLSGETLLCIFGVRMHFDPSTYGGTLVEAREVMEALNKSKLWMKAGSDRLFELRGLDLVDYGGGLAVGNDGAGTAVPSRSTPQERRPYHLLADAKIIGPTQQLDCRHYVSKASWTTDNDFDVAYDLFAFVARKA
jgi:hypothetical protein